MPKVHRFASTGEAYDASQTDEAISDGDVLVVVSEGVVGILVEAWPVAVTEVTGEFHQHIPDFDWSAVRCFAPARPYDRISDPPRYENRDYTPSLDLARQEAGKLTA